MHLPLEIFPPFVAVYGPLYHRDNSTPINRNVKSHSEGHIHSTHPHNYIKHQQLKFLLCTWHAFQSQQGGDFHCNECCLVSVITKISCFIICSWADSSDIMPLYNNGTMELLTLSSPLHFQMLFASNCQFWLPPF
jgi:hypothetical protein